MATTINWGSIQGKVNAAVESSGAVGSNAAALAAAAGSAFASHLSSQISSSGLSAGAIAAVGQPSVGGVSGGGTTATVTVTLDGENRPSLVPEKYGGVDDMCALLNNGYSCSGAVRGEWHGNIIWSRTSFGGAHFVEGAVSSFPRETYHVIDISYSV